MKLEPQKEFSHCNDKRLYGLDVWGHVSDKSSEICYIAMTDRLRKHKNFTIPRQILERLDLEPYVKLVYAALAHWPKGARWRMEELVGLCGITYAQATKATARLIREGYIKEVYYGDSPKPTKRDQGMPPRLVPTPIQSKFDDPDYSPEFLKSDISNIKEEIEGRFYGLNFK